jgi:hypothetical protein
MNTPTENKGTGKARKIAYWATTILGPASFVIGGSLFLAHAEQPVQAMEHLGISADMLYVLGVWKVLGAIVCVVPGIPLLKEWAYAGFFFELTGAAALHAMAGDPFIGAGPFTVFNPLIFLALVIASWALRPASRRSDRNGMIARTSTI